MEQPLDNLNPRKRGSETLEFPLHEDDTSKRACLEPSSSPHLKLLEELYDLEAEDDEAVAESPEEPSNQEDLVAEMMKSLEKVIENKEARGEGETSTSSPSRFPSDLDVEWGDDEIPQYSGSPLEEASFNGELTEGGLQEDEELRQMLQASDDELGVPLSVSSDLEESSFHEEWASLADDAGNMGWFEVPFQQFDDGPSMAKEMFEPLLLF